MKYINIKFVLPVFIIIAFATAGCKKGFLDINKDPNRVTDDNITANLIFTQAANAVGGRAASGNFTFANNWVGYWSASGSFAIDQIQTTYNIDFPFGDPLWQNHYNVLFDLYLVKQKALAVDDKVLAGASMILLGKIFQELVDVFFDVSYFQGFLKDQYCQTAYHKT